MYITGIICVYVLHYIIHFTQKILYVETVWLSCGDILIFLAYYLQIRNIIAFLQFLTLSNLKIIVLHSVMENKH